MQNESSEKKEEETLLSERGNKNIVHIIFLFLVVIEETARYDASVQATSASTRSAKGNSV